MLQYAMYCTVNLYDPSEKQNQYYLPKERGFKYTEPCERDLLLILRVAGPYVVQHAPVSILSFRVVGRIG